MECDQCGACCRQVLVEVEDLDVLREPHLATADIGDWTREITYETLMAELEEGKCLVIAGGGESCKFLRQSNTCAIYPTRPNACVAMQAGDEQCRAARAAEGLPRLGKVGREVGRDGPTRRGG